MNVLLSIDKYILNPHDLSYNSLLKNLQTKQGIHIPSFNSPS